MAVTFADEVGTTVTGEAAGMRGWRRRATATAMREKGEESGAGAILGVSAIRCNWVGLTESGMPGHHVQVDSSFDDLGAARKARALGDGCEILYLLHACSV